MSGDPRIGDRITFSTMDRNIIIINTSKERNESVSRKETPAESLIMMNDIRRNISAAADEEPKNRREWP